MKKDNADKEPKKNMENEILEAMENMRLNDSQLKELTTMMSNLEIKNDNSRYQESYYNNCFTKLNFEGAYIPSTLFNKVVIEDCNFSSASSGDIKAIDCSLFNVNYNFIKCQKILFPSSYLQNCSFDGIEGELELENTFFESGVFDGKLARGKFNQSNFKDVIFGRNLVDLSSTNCEYINCSFDFSHMTTPIFINCKFNNCSFEGVSCYDGYFDSCFFINSNFNGSLWNGSTFSSCHFETCEDFISISHAKLIGTTSTNGILEYILFNRENL